MMMPNPVQQIFGGVGNIGIFIIFLFQVPDIEQILIKHDTGNLQPYTHMLYLMNHILWTLYGLPIVQEGGLCLITGNGMGLAFQIVCLCIFFRSTTEKYKVIIIAGLLAEMVMLLSVVRFALSIPMNERPLFVGLVCIAVTFPVLGFPAFLTIERAVKGNAEPFIDDHGFYAGNCVMWMCYAIVPFDYCIMTVSMIGMGLSLAPMLVVVCFRLQKVYATIPTEATKNLSCTCVKSDASTKSQ